MKIEESEFGGTDVLLTSGDRLEDIPQSHQHLVTAPVRRTFPDPIGNLADIIDRCPFQEMKRWLKNLHKIGDWHLVIHRAEYDDSGMAGFHWSGGEARSAIISPFLEGDFPDDCPADINTYYQLVDSVIWNGIGAGGSIYGSEHSALSTLTSEPGGDPVDPEETYIWGDSPCGDNMIWTIDGRAGWYALGSHKVQLLGSIADTINHVYGELNSGEAPGWDYQSW